MAHRRDPIHQLKKPFSTPFLSDSTHHTSPQAHASTSNLKGKGKARDSGVGLMEGFEKGQQVMEEEQGGVKIEEEHQAWTVQWRAPQAKKNKTWEL
jgi:hypothetical protein